MKKVWQPAILVSLEIQGHVLPFWKSPIKICFNPDCQVGSSILKVHQAMLKSWGLLNKVLYASDLKWAPLYIPLTKNEPLESNIWRKIIKGKRAYLKGINFGFMQRIHSLVKKALNFGFSLFSSRFASSVTAWKGFVNLW